MCFVGFEKTLLGEDTSTGHLVPASTPEIEPPGSISGRKQPKKHQMAVNSTLKAPQATRDLGMARADRSAAWRARQHAKSRRATARSVSLRAPPFPSWKWPSLPVIPRTSSLPVEYRGPNAEHPDSRLSIATTTRHSLSIAPRAHAFFLSQVAGAHQKQNRASTRTRFTFCFAFWGAHGTSHPPNE